MNRLGTIIYYVENVEKTIEFFEKAFGLVRSFIDPTGSYGQLETGMTSLGFASLELAKQNLPQGYQPISRKALPGCEISFTAKDVHRSLNHAVKAGAELIASPEEKPWGQTVAYVRDLNGILIEIASDMMAACSKDSCCCH
ncbi:MAG: VOC family protein [Verrucomicrobia bacterium]|nr:VOC family protein [Verrucomicrobiota bacterium]MDE3046882.1 VOC family protein [Verrucomicrobiota bacterium]